MRGQKEKRGIVELGKRSIVNFFEHPMSTYGVALAYRGLFGLFPFLFILVVLAGALGLADYLERAIDQASSESSQNVPEQLQPMIERGKEQLQSLEPMIEQAHKRAGGELLFFGVALALWSISALAGTLTEAFNAAYEVSRDPSLVEDVGTLSGLRPDARARGDRLHIANVDRARFDRAYSGVGRSRGGVRLVVGVAALPHSPLPASRGALTHLPIRPQRQAALSLGDPGRCAGRGSVGNNLGWLLLLPGNLRQLRSHLREPWGGRGFAVLPLPVRFGSVVRRRAKRRDLPPGHERQRKGTKLMGSGSKEDASMSNESRYQQRLSTFAANWRALALRGLLALLFGLVVLFWPGLVLTVLALLFGIYAAVDGAITFVPALRSPDRGAQKSLPLAEGAVGIVAGLVAILWPGLTTSGLVYVIAGWAVVTGVLKILTAVLLRAEVENGWLLAGSGALSALFGILLVVLAGSDVPFLAPFIGGFAVVVGLALIVFAFRLRERR